MTNQPNLYYAYGFWVFHLSTTKNQCAYGNYVWLRKPKAHVLPSGSSASSCPPMYDLQWLPGILEATGISTTSIRILDDWGTILNNEYTQRSQRKRSADDGGSTGFDSTGHECGSVNDSQPEGHSDSVHDDGHHTYTPTADGCYMTLDWPSGSEQSLVPYAMQPEPSINPMNPGGDRVRHEHDPEPYLKSLSHSDLVVLALRQHRQIQMLERQCATQNAQLSKQTKKTRRFVQKARRLKSKVAHNKITIKQLKHPDLADLEVFRNKSRYLTWRGGISLGLRKAIALASASTFPQAALLDVGRHSVTRSEHMVGDLLVTRAMVFNKLVFELMIHVRTLQTDVPDNVHHDHYLSTSTLVSRDIVGDQSGSVRSHDDALCADLGLPMTSQPAQSFAALHPFPDKRVYIAATFWSGDATNSAIWQRQKLVGMLTNNIFLANWEALSKDDYAQAFRTMRAMYLGSITLICKQGLEFMYTYHMFFNLMI